VWGWSWLVEIFRVRQGRVADGKNESGILKKTLFAIVPVSINKN
jgi:hypothetical protein